jgi:hypothetical protein
LQIPSKRCSRCRETKPLGDFAWRYIERGLHDSYCRPCRSAYKKEHYKRNKDRYQAQALDYKQRIYRQRTEWLLDYFLLHPCTDCGETDPVVLEFDHSEGKDFNISSGLLNKAWSAIVEEIAKCEVVCVNCHRRRTAREQGFARLLLHEELN